MSWGCHEESVDEVVPLEVVERAEGEGGMEATGRNEADPGSDAGGFDATESFAEEEREESEYVDGPGSCRVMLVRAMASRASRAHLRRS
jgi:hypothetical protein